MCIERKFLWRKCRCLFCVSLESSSTRARRLYLGWGCVIILILILILARVTLRVRIANWVGEDSYCRGGIVSTRGALFVRPQSTKALWRFRASTSNSLSGLMWPHTHTAFRYSYHKLTLNEIFECVEMTICSRPIGSPKIPRRFDFFA